jgi:hypothetical protein
MYPMALAATDALEEWLNGSRLRRRDLQPNTTEPFKTGYEAVLAEGIRDVARGLLALAKAHATSRCVSYESSTDLVREQGLHAAYPWLASRSEMVSAQSWNTVEHHGSDVAGAADFGFAGSLGLDRVLLEVSRDHQGASMAQLGLVLPGRSYTDEGSPVGYTVATVGLDGTLRAVNCSLAIAMGNYVTYATSGAHANAVVQVKKTTHQNLDRMVFPGFACYLADALPRLGHYFKLLANATHS